METRLPVGAGRNTGQHGGGFPSRCNDPEILFIIFSALLLSAGISGTGRRRVSDI
jgi:hypothetical protein